MRLGMWLWWFEWEWTPMVHIFESLVLSRWNCLGKVRWCGFVGGAVSLRVGLWGFKSQDQDQCLSASKLLTTCNLSVTFPGPGLLAAMLHVIIVMSSPSESVSKPQLRSSKSCLLIVSPQRSRAVKTRMVDHLLTMLKALASIPSTTQNTVLLAYYWSNIINT